MSYIYLRESYLSDHAFFAKIASVTHYGVGAEVKESLLAFTEHRPQYPGDT